MSIEITDEQYKAICHYIGIPLSDIEKTPKEDMSQVDGLILSLVNSFNPTQLQQLCEQHGGSFMKFIALDADISSVINKDNKECLAFMTDESFELCVYRLGDFIDGNGYGCCANDGITHIAKMPPPPKEK